MLLFFLWAEYGAFARAVKKAQADCGVTLSSLDTCWSSQRSERGR